MAHSTDNLYTATDVRALFTQYVQTKNLVNANDPQFVNVSEDDALARAVAQKGDQQPEFLRRQDAVERIRANMQEWYELRSGENGVQRKCVVPCPAYGVFTAWALNTHHAGREHYSPFTW